MAIPKGFKIVKRGKCKMGDWVVCDFVECFADNLVGHTIEVCGNVGYTVYRKPIKKKPLNIDDKELDVKHYAAVLGSRGGKKSRRTLTPDQAKKMVAAREKKKLDRKQTG